MIIQYKITREDLKQQDRSNISKEKADTDIVSSDPDLLVRVLLKMQSM